MTLGLYRLQARMRQTRPEWNYTILTNKPFRFALPVLFIGGNFINLYFGARSREMGKIPRFWLPAVFFLIMSGSLMYWSLMMLMRVEIPGTDLTIGKKIGFEVIVYNETDDSFPGGMGDAMVQARLDGSRRRVAYTVSTCSSRHSFTNILLVLRHLRVCWRSISEACELCKEICFLGCVRNPSYLMLLELCTVQWRDNHI